MKKTMAPLVGLALLALGATAQDKIEITANMPELTDGDVVFLWNAFADLKDSAYVKNNSFSITQEMPGGGSTFILQAGKDPEKTGLGMVMMMQPGKMHIEGGNGTGFKGAKFSGDSFVADWLKMDNEMLSTHGLLNQLEDMNADYNEANKLGDKEAAKRIFDEMQGLNTQIKANGKRFLDANLGSSASAYVINALMDNMLTNTEKIAYLNKFTGSAYNNHIAKTMLKGLTGSEAQWIGRPAPDFTQPDATGKLVSLKAFKGKYVLVDFWASWCVPCRLEVPELKEVYEKFKSKNVEFVSISIDEDKSKWQKAMLEENMPWPQLSDSKGENNTAKLAFQVEGIPAKFLIDPNGIIVGVSFREKPSGGGKVKILEKSLNDLVK